MTDLERDNLRDEIPALLDLLAGNPVLWSAFVAEMGRRGFELPVVVERSTVNGQPITVDFGPASDLVAALKRLGHEVFFAKAGKGLNLNIVYVRDTSPELDAYGCKLFVFWQEEVAGKWTVKEWSVTTYPGSTYLIRRLLSSAGTAILREGQYKGVYALSKHRGVYEALCQRLGNVECYRDKNRDKHFDLDSATVTRGDYGINCHAPVTPSDGVKNYVADVVGSSSAGCLVFKKMADFLAFRDLCRSARDVWGNAFTVTLIRDTDLLKGPDPVGSAPSPSLLDASPISADGLALVQHFEGCLKPDGKGNFAAYPDPAHGWTVPTIGWGTIHYPDGREVKRGDVITQAQADSYLADELGKKSLAVLRMVKVKITDDQHAALVSFAYNLGEGSLAGSTLLKKLNAGDYKGAAEEFPKWNHAAGKVMAGLTRRRLSERRLFFGERPFIVKS